MESSARLYNCARCHRQVVICSDCDRGNLYCGKTCAQAARRTSQRAAARRYQQSRRGRWMHAERQRRYRLRHKKVTHQGSAAPVPNGPLTARSEVPAVEAKPERVIRCHFCGRSCSPFMRLDFLHRSPTGGRAERRPIHSLPGYGGQAP